MSKEKWILVKQTNNKDAYLKVNMIAGIVFGIREGIIGGNPQFISGHNALINCAGINVIVSFETAKGIIPDLEMDLITDTGN